VNKEPPNVSHDHETDEARPEPTRRWKNLHWVGLAAFILAVAVAAIGIQARRHDETQVTQWTQDAAIPTVAVIAPEQGASDLQLVLPGNMQAWFEAPIYARVDGYVKNWYFDIGARVKKGQVLAELEAPELDAELATIKAKLDRENAQVKVREAEVEFAKTTYDRWRGSPPGVVSQQETEAKKKDYNSSLARLNAALADAGADKGDLDRLQALEDFKKITVPFDGVVTARETDVGALINAGKNGQQLFRVADVHKMRTFVQVPQQMSGGIHRGLTADLVLPQHPDKIFVATVVTTSHAIETNARTLLVELNCDNPGEALEPGSYAEVHFKLPSAPGMVLLPTSALLFREEGLQIAVIGPDSKVELKKVTLGRNLGTQVEVIKGVARTDRVVNSPPDSLAADDLVRIAAQPAGKSKQEEVATGSLPTNRTVLSPRGPRSVAGPITASPSSSARSEKGIGLVDGSCCGDMVPEREQRK
jgi:RND family efflux transporter MFP subunit